jgi:hypothetical protein
VLRLLKNNRPSGLAFILFLMTLLFLKTALYPGQQSPMNGMPLYDLLFGPLHTRPVAAAFISLAIYGLLLLLVVRFNMIHFMLEDRTYMPATFFLLIVASWSPAMLLSPVLLSAPFLLLAILVLIRGEEHQADPLALFNATLLLAVGSLFYLKILWFIPFFWITASIIRPLRWRGFVNPLVVLVIMGMFLVTYYWVFRNDLALLSGLLKDNLAMNDIALPAVTTPELIMFGYLFLLVMIASIHLLGRYQFRKIIIRKLYMILFLLSIYGLLFCFLISGCRGEVMVVLALPLTYLFSNFFYRKKNPRIHEVLIWIWLGLVVYVQIAPIAGW